MTPEEQFALLNFMGMGAYGSPLATSPNSQLNLVQDIGSMAFDAVFGFNMGLITPEQMLEMVRNATTQPVGEPDEYNWEKIYNQFTASNQTELLEGADAIRSGQLTAAQYIRELRSKFNKEGRYDEFMSSQIDSLSKELNDFERVYRNYELAQSKVDSNEWSIDPNTGMLMKPIFGEEARQNMRALGWKGPLSDPEMWRKIPDMATLQQAAKLQQEFAPIFEAYEKDQETIDKGTRQQIAAKSPAMKKLLELKPELAGEKVTTTRGWQEIENAYNKAMSDFKAKRNAKSNMSGGREELGVVKGMPQGTFRWVITVENGKEVARGYTGDYGSKLGAYLSSPGDIAQLRNKSSYQKTNPAQPSQAEKSDNYWAQQAAYYTAKSMGAERDTRQAKAKAAESKVDAKIAEAERRGSVPALQLISALPQIAAMAATPAPQEPREPRPQYVRPQPRTLSDAEIELMANMIAGGMQ